MKIDFYMYLMGKIAIYQNTHKLYIKSVDFNWIYIIFNTMKGIIDIYWSIIL